MLSGLPASGKSTRAKEIVETGNWIRVNRDLLRTMLHFDKFSSRNEGDTIDAEKALVRFFLSKDKSVVVDDTNLNPKNREMWSTIAKECNATFETEKIETDWLECLIRNMRREKAVPPHVIRNMALQQGLIPHGKGFVICDLDGTLAEISHRRHFVETLPKNWKSFFEGIEGDTLREDVAKMLREYKEEGYEIIFISARPEDYRPHTERWLENNRMAFAFTLIMRNSGDSRPDTEIKKQILDNYFPDKKKIWKNIISSYN